LADITGLDRLGLPVWQAVRPEGRALSVHQGKGCSPLTARIGALCEAIESHCAEHVEPDGPLASFSGLPAAQRAPDLSDLCVDRDRLPDPDEIIPWCEATDLVRGTPHYLPHALVSLDFRSGLPNRIERVSAGTGAGATEKDALEVALLELIERDAVAGWQQLAGREQAATSLNPGTIPFDWFRSWRERLTLLGVELELFELASIVGIPAFMCVIGATEEFGPAYRRFSGTAAHPYAEQALFKALAEALQSRLTLIAGVRDDILPSYYERHATSRKSPHWPALGARRWSGADNPGDVPGWIDALARQGYRQVAVKRLDRGLDGIAVVKAFIPGLGSLTRTRRVPA
jgi:ribosomal protein S12 methylthiotransferase accessory factor